MTTEKMTEVRENIAREMMCVLSDRNYYYTDYAIYQIVDEFFDQKEELIELLSHHPLWDDDKLMIQFDTDMKREICTAEVHNFAFWLTREVKYTMTGLTDDLEYVIENFIYRISTQFIADDENILARLNAINKINPKYDIRNNAKSSKAIGKICRVEGWDKFEGYNKRYAALCDCLNPLKIKRHTCISVNPIDFLLMSNGDSWHSCHDIAEKGDAGCYSSGTISYMLDKHSFLFYTVDASYNGNQIELAKKAQREVFGYNDEVLAQSRLYPQSNDAGAEQVYSDIRAIVQKIIADCIGKPNYWTLSRNDVNDVIIHGWGATCYPDWENGNPGSAHCSISTLKDREKGKDDREIIFGAEPICIECGYRHDVTENISCCESGYVTCENCGERIPEEDVIYVDGYYYCDDCVTYCDCCNEYHLRDNVSYIDGEYVCDDCLNDSGNYGICEVCGDAHHIDRLYITENGDVYCEDCVDDNTCRCGRCDGLISIDYAKFDEETEEDYCEDCYDEIIANREEDDEDAA